MEQGAGPEDPPQTGLGAGRPRSWRLWVTQVREERWEQKKPSEERFEGCQEQESEQPGDVRGETAGGI